MMKFLRIFNKNLNKQSFSRGRRSSIGRRSLLCFAVFALTILLHLSCADHVVYSESLDSERPQPVGFQGEDWTLTFQDEFAEGRLDPTKWNIGWPWGRTADHVDEYIADENVVVTDGVLKIISREEDRGGQRYTSGMVTTHALFEQQYGYFEVRAKAARGMGLVSAFWLATDESWPPELDIFEVLGRAPTTVHMTHHFRNAAGEAANAGQSWRGLDFAADFHTYGFLWSESALVWYIDGVERHRVTRAAEIPDTPMYMLLNVHVGGDDWWGWPDATTPWPTTMEVEYARAWTR